MPNPLYAFTLPSIDDDTPLACRIYHPKNLRLEIPDSQADLRGAVIAHPYAPLGGSYDDAVVLSVTETLVNEGHIVMTFNFRGATGSAGHTSWTGRPETDDYSSVVGFLIEYLQDIRRPGSEHIVGSDRPPPLQIILGGYSYGSLVLARVPPPEAITQRLREATTGTAAYEIMIRARRLAERTWEATQEAVENSVRGRGQGSARSTPPARSFPLTMGGEETDSSERRRSRESKRALSIARKSAQLPHRIKVHSREHSEKKSRLPHDPQHSEDDVFGEGQDRAEEQAVNPKYLLISPVLLPLTTLLCPPGPSIPFVGMARHSGAENGGYSFTKHNTLALFGTADVFTSSKRLQTWAEKQKASNPHFEWKEIEDAGHFWHEEGAMEALEGRIASWVKGLTPV
ncbi:hypothetical protein KC332_g15914 [Hortaea werneckii]|uniref:Uncharacterized protein n=1 Tax=Hortaea werneckii EXF-2000 TaxID=1157616 RepID=A0A1Z5T7Z6_HORWE|nr:hypothetical protein KC358_g17753 [Hortaea werneckii]OTA32157.1 hypothetical protein BTJ68_07854 [Hortaea werneckii EXF-2000]KAI6801048.1 hypothetical protein KC350_g15735 [Hortaea werneckii]KAI6902684.1 hypothetical protein KC348_g15991 [Hortaea werneckii]KAI6919308.1 hypothetical protein KC341_g17392 [Hortaea werneckii]